MIPFRGEAIIDDADICRDAIYRVFARNADNKSD